MKAALTIEQWQAIQQIVRPSLELVKPDSRFRESFLAALREMSVDSERHAWIYLGNNAPLDLPEQDFDGYVETLLLREFQPPAGFVCDTVYWALHNTEVVGRIAIRHELNEFLKREGGHLGYIVRPSWRRRGVATEMLRQLLLTERARAIGNLLATCDEGNITSEKTILRNGGRFESTADMGPGRPSLKRFWIQLTSAARGPDRPAPTSPR